MTQKFSLRGSLLVLKKQFLKKKMVLSIGKNLIGKLKRKLNYSKSPLPFFQQLRKRGGPGRTPPSKKTTTITKINFFRNNDTNQTNA